MSTAPITPIEQARRLAKNTDCPITRRLLVELVQVIEEKDQQLSEQKRINTDLRRCNECMNEAAAEAFSL